MIDRGLNKIRAGAIDVHGYRKFQSLLRYHESIVKDEAKYEQVLMALLEALESPDGDRPLGRSLDLKTQVLVTVRMLRSLNAPLFAKYYARTMTAIITARKHYDGTNHIVSGLEETSEDIVAACDPPEVIDATLDLIENGGNTPEAYRMIAMGTYILSGLLHRLNEKNLFLADPELKRLGDFARQNLRNPQPDVRRAVIEFSLELYDMVKPEEVFWSMIDSPTEDVRPLLTYYIMRKQTRT
jgi:CLIP-associating protein 1/2